MKKMVHRSEFFLGLTIIILCLAFGLTNRTFFTIGNLFDLLQSSVELGVFALGVLLVIISGGIDVSFTAIAIFSLYTTTKLISGTPLQGNVIWAFLISSMIGLFLGFINAVFIAFFRLPTLIVTLGTMGVFQGFMLAFVGTDLINNLPSGMAKFGQSMLFKAASGSGVVGLPTYFLIFVIGALLVWLLLRYTVLGRAIYALGGDAVSAARVGFNLLSTQIFIYCFVGLLSGVVGIVHGTIIQTANPYDLVGTELNVIAAVILGGARITGGHGTVGGTLLGVFLVDIITNNLVLLGIPAFWQQAIIGILIIFGTSITALESRREKRVSLIEG